MESGTLGSALNKSFNHNYNKILKSDWLSAVLISGPIGQLLDVASTRHA